MLTNAHSDTAVANREVRWDAVATSPTSSDVRRDQLFADR